LTNRQFGTVNWNQNMNHTNYHSMQAQVTLRPTHGLNFQATYTWSRNLGDTGAGTDPLNRAADYGILASSRSHSLTTYGTYNLPLGGPNGYLFRDSSSWVKKIAEGWQLSWVSSVTSGLPYSVTTINSMFAGSGVDLINANLFDPKGGEAKWGYADPNGRLSGRFYGTKYVQVTDPQCSSVDDTKPYPGGASLRDTCGTNLHALALASDPSKIIFQHAQPGVRGSFQPNSLTSPGRWSLDMAVSKNITIKEGKSLNFRMDINNIFNHPTPSGTAPSSYDQRTYAAGAPIADLNSTDPFGYIGWKVSHRVFSAKLRLTF
jgi:hypothetical protein